MRYQVGIELPFEAAHRLMNHSGKCRHLHGHSYRASLVLETDKLDDSSMVVDFAVLKATIGNWIDKNWDHNILLQSGDPLDKLFFSRGNTDATQEQVTLSEEIFRGKEPYRFLHPPTAEVLADELFSMTLLMLGVYNVTLVSVTIHETVKCFATVRVT